jgi:hypothetical protein
MAKVHAPGEQLWRPSRLEVRTQAAAGLVHPILVRVEDVGRLLLHGLDDAVQGRFGQRVVLVEERDVVAFGQCQSAVQRRRDPAPFCCKCDTNPRVRYWLSPQPIVEPRLGWPVAANTKTPIFISLRAGRGKGRFQPLATGPVHRHCDADQRLVRPSAGLLRKDFSRQQRCALGRQPRGVFRIWTATLPRPRKLGVQRMQRRLQKRLP